MRFATILGLASVTLLAQGRPIKRASADTILVLKFAQVLEQLETQFYQTALSKFQAKDFIDAGFVSAAVAVDQITVIASDEAAHSSLLENAIVALGETPITGCTFDFGTALDSVTSMAGVARLIENVGVSAYAGAIPLLDDPVLLVDAVTIVTIEARHSSIWNIFNGGSAISQPTDIPLSASQILAIAGSFISGCNLGVAPSPALSVSAPGAIAPGTQLSFTSPGISSNTTGLFCQMLTGGSFTALVFPFESCIVPQINGIVYIYVTNTDAPLLSSDLTDQNVGSIVAGPAGAYVDTIPDSISQLILTGPNASSNDVQTTTTITPPSASAVIQSATADGAVVVLGSSSTSSAPASSQTPPTQGVVNVIGSGSASNSTNNNQVKVLGASSTTGSSAPSSTTKATSSTSGTPSTNNAPVKVLGSGSVASSAPTNLSNTQNAQVEVLGAGSVSDSVAPSQTANSGYSYGGYY